MILLDRVTKTYNRNPHAALERVSLHVEPKEFVIVVGASGAGKSTLLKLLTREEKPTGGKIIVGGIDYDKLKDKDIPLLRRKIGVVFQDFKLLEDRNVYDNVSFSLHVAGISSKEIKKRVLTVLTQVGLSHKRNAMPHQLSGGEQQRVCIARALVNEPFLILADEPTGNLDPGTSLEILKLLLDINQRGTAVLMTTHNYDLVRKGPGRILQIKDKNVREVQLKQ